MADVAADCAAARLAVASAIVMMSAELIGRAGMRSEFRVVMANLRCGAFMVRSSLKYSAESRGLQGLKLPPFRGHRV
jgi:hypothetical protein